jgi:hypothetical protein
MHIFSSRTHYTWIHGEELWEVDTTSKDYQQEEIFESAVLDEGQELGVPLGWRSKMYTRQTDSMPICGRKLRRRCGLYRVQSFHVTTAAQYSRLPSAVRVDLATASAALAGTTFGFPFRSTLSSAGSNPPFPHNAHSGVGLQ